MALLAGSVALGYFTIAAFIAPRIRMPGADQRVLLALRVAAVAFFVGCGLTHSHILVHTLFDAADEPVEFHEMSFHVFQAVGAWLFILGAALRFELAVVPAETRTQLRAKAEVERQRAEEERLRAEEAEHLASHDELTGLSRRWRFEEELERQVALAARHGTKGALLLIDVDGLKPVNDTEGHQAGDRVLIQVADAMRRGLRSTDVGARIGGDEFALVLADVGLAAATNTANRLVGALRSPSSPGVAGTSVSIGIAVIDGTEPTAEVVRRADQAMYVAKREGGDRYVVGAITDAFLDELRKL